MTMDPAQFTTALHQHLCVIATTQDSKQIQESTRLLKQQFYSNPQCVLSILQIIAAVNDIPVTVRQLAAVEGRKQVKQHWKKLSAENQNAVKEKILEYVIQEPDNRVQQGLTHIVAAIGQKELRKRKWGQLVDALMNGCQSADIRHREVCLLILREVMADIVVAYEENRVLPVLELIATQVQDPDHPHLRLLATEAISSAAAVSEKKNKRQVQFYRSMIPYFFKVLTETCSDEALAKRSFEAFDYILGSECPILTPHFMTFVQLLVATVSNPSLLSEVRVLAGNAIILLPLYKRKLLIKQKLIEPILDHILPLTIDATFEEEEAEETPSSVALRIIHAFTSYLPPKHLFPVISKKLTSMAQDPNPSIRISAIRCLGLTVEGCAEQIRMNLESSIQLLCQQMMDTHANVRKAACETLSQFFEVFSTEVASYHSHLVPRLLECVQDPNAKLMAVNALDVLLESMESEDVVLYLPTLVQCFLVLLQDADIDVRQQTASAVGSTAHCAGEAFRPFFPHVFPSILNLLSLSNQSDSKEMVLRGIGIDTMSAIAQAVGPDVFRDQVSVVCPLIVESMHMKAPKLKECAFCFFGVLSGTFKREFSPFLSGLVPALFESVLVEESAEIVDETEDSTQSNENHSIATPLRLNAGDEVDLENDEDSVSDLDDDLDLDDEDEDDDEFGASNMLAEEKATAIEVLGELFESTQQDFLPYLEESTTHVLSQAHHFNEEVRKNVLITLCKFMEQYYTLAKDASIPVPSEAHASSFTRNIMNTILPVLEEEEAPLVLSEAFDNLQSLLRSMKTYLIEQDPTHLERLCQLLLAVFNGQHISQKAMEARTDDEGNEEDGEVGEVAGGGDQDEDAGSPLLDQDDSALVSACDVMSALCHALGPNMATYVTVFLPELMKRLDELETDELSSVIGSFADVCVGLKSGVNACVHLLLPVFQQIVTKDNVDAMSNAVYGLGVLVQHCELALDEASILQHILPCLKSSLPQCVDNACGALARILYKKRQEWGVHPELVPILLDHLPLRDDFQENEPVVLYLQFILHHHFNACTPFLPKFMHIFAHAFENVEERLPFPELSASTLHLLKSLLNPIQPGVQESIQALPPEMQAVLQKALYQ